MTVPDLLDHLRATFSPDAPVEYDELFERIRTTPLLILDDLGTESSTPWAQEKLYQLLNHRYLHRLSTVITTNSDLERIDPRIRSRLVDKTLTYSVHMSVPDFRRTDAPREASALTNLQIYGEMTFETFDPREQVLPEQERRNLRQALELAQKYAEAPTNWVVLMGEHGCGKTHLAAAIANYRKRLGENVVFVTTPDLLDYLRAAYNQSSGTTFDRRFHEIRTAPLLIIDQLDLTNATPWALEKIRQIIDYRYLANLHVLHHDSDPGRDGPDDPEPAVRWAALSGLRDDRAGLPGRQGARAASHAHALSERHKRPVEASPLGAVHFDTE